MKKRRFIALALVLCMLAGTIPVMHAAEEQRQNVLNGAHYEGQFNLNEEYYSDSLFGGKSDPTKLVDNRYGAGPSNKDNGLNTKILDQSLLYDANGKIADDGTYLWGVTFRLDRAYEVDGFTLITDDLSNLNIGISSTVPWLQMGFDILVSESGEDGSWQVVHQAQQLHTATSKGQYTYISSQSGYYTYSASFSKVSAKYVRFASTSLTCPDFDKSHWINITEFQLFSNVEIQDTDPVPSAKGNVMRRAKYIKTVNVATDKYSSSAYGGVSDPSKMTDGRYGVGPTNKDEGFNSRTIDKWTYYDADGKEDVYGDYIWSVTFELDGEYLLDSLSLITMDLTPFVGDTNPEQWLPRGFDILVSESGLPGSWLVAHRAEDLHTEDDPGAYTWFAPTDDFPMGYYEYTASFTPIKAKYVQYGCTDYTSSEIEQNHWINISELKIYTMDPIGSTPALPNPPVDARNVMSGSVWSDSVNLRTCAYTENADGTRSDPSKLVDGRWAVTSNYTEEGMNTRVYDVRQWYDEDNNPSDDFLYLWTVTFTLDRLYEVDSFRLINLDLTDHIGDTNPVQWLQRYFEILVSETGEDGSWQLAYIGWNVHTETDPGQYVYHPATETNLAYYDLEGNFNEPLRARYVKFASRGETTSELSTADWINISELQVFGEEVTDKNTDSGTCGENLTWELNEYGVLSITGTGDMYDFGTDDVPWKNYRSKIQTVSIAEGVTSIRTGAFSQCYALTDVHIPKSVTHIDESAFDRCRSVTAFTVDSENVAYMADAAGALLTKDGKTLLQFPIGKQMDAYTIPDTVTYMGAYAFGECKIAALTVPAGTVQIGTNAFISSSIGRLTVLCDSVDLKPANIPLGTVIRGYAGSTAESYAKEYGNSFEAIHRGGVRGRIHVANPNTPVYIRLTQGEADVHTATLTASAETKTILFSFHGVEAGTYDLQITGEGFLSYTISGIVVEEAVVDLTTHPNESLSNITMPAGDVNGDSRIDLQDVVILTSQKTYGRSYEDAAQKSADVNGDKKFDLQDLVIITSKTGYCLAPIRVSFGE